MLLKEALNNLLKKKEALNGKVIEAPGAMLPALFIRSNNRVGSTHFGVVRNAFGALLWQY